MDISSYLKLLDAQANSTPNQLLAQQIKLYRDFVAELVKVNTVLDKKFYICVPYSYLEKGAASSAARTMDKKSQKGEEFVSQAKTALHSKAESLHSQLARLNLRAKTLEKEELIKLFYEIFNDDDVETHQVSDNMSSPFVKREQK